MIQIICGLDELYSGLFFRLLLAHLLSDSESSECKTAQCILYSAESEPIATKIPLFTMCQSGRCRPCSRFLQAIIGFQSFGKFNSMVTSNNKSIPSELRIRTQGFNDYGFESLFAPYVTAVVFFFSSQLTYIETSQQSIFALRPPRSISFFYLLNFKCPFHFQ